MPRRVLFHDPIFLFGFLPATLLCYRLVPRPLSNAWLLLASLVFYGSSSLSFLPLLLASTALDFVAGGAIARSDRPGARRAWLLVSLVGNLGLLATFKYAGWITGLLADAGLPITPVELPLPVGISFFTFQTMSYTIDVYRGEVASSRSIVDFAAYVTLFPQLIAGPIVRYREVADQLQARATTIERLASGVHLFVFGLAKKVLLADAAAWLAAPLLGVSQPTSVEAWVSALLFSVQIYFDFSGYSDMAVGLGRMFGFEFPQNFDSPYQASSFSDFWRRWHMTLSRWLRDNLYVPLGGNRAGAGRTYVNLMLTMALGGLWHGADLNFLVWGLWHGGLLSIERLARDHLPWLDPPAWLRRAVVFLAVTTGWTFFFCDSFDRSVTWLGAMVSLDLAPGLVTGRQAAFTAALLLPCFVLPNTWSWRARLDWRGGVVVGVVLVLAVVGALGQATSPFLYYRF